MVLYFTGTGNSQHIARVLAEGLSDSLYSINDGVKTHTYPDVAKEDTLVVSAPTYAWRLPHVVNDWFLSSDLFAGKKAYFLLNCGDHICDAPKYLKKLCESTKMTYMGCAKLFMPENYIARYQVPSEEESVTIVKKADEELKPLIEDIRQQEPFPEIKVSPIDWFNSTVVNPIFYRTVIGSDKYRTLESCNGCGNCVKVCPMNNITLKENRPVWDGNCTHCMACICDCPKEAIEYGDISVGKRRYRCPDVDDTEG